MRTGLYIGLALIIFVSAAWIEKKDFSGVWIIDTKNSILGGLDPVQAAPAYMNIAQKGESIRLHRKFGPSKAIEEYQFNGLAIDTVMGNYNKTSFLKWDDTGAEFTVSAKYKVSEPGRTPWEYTRTETYSLSTDGRMLTLKRTSVLPDRTESVIAIYDKQ